MLQIREERTSARRRRTQQQVWRRFQFAQGNVTDRQTEKLLSTQQGKKNCSI